MVVMMVVWLELQMAASMVASLAEHLVYSRVDWKVALTVASMAVQSVTLRVDLKDTKKAELLAEHLGYSMVAWMVAWTVALTAER